VRPYVIGGALVAVVLLGTGVVLVVAGMFTHPTRTSCFLVLRADDEHIETYRDSLSAEGYSVQTTRSSVNSERAVLRASVEPELTARMGFGENDNGIELETAMARAVPGDRPRPRCSDEQLAD